MTATAQSRFAIDISVTPGVSGGIAQSTQGLVASLGQLDGPDEYVLVTRTSEQTEWVRQFKGPNQRIVMRPAGTWWRLAPHADRDLGGLKRTVKPALNLVRQIFARFVPQPQFPEVPVSDGFYETLGCQALHFPTQWFIVCALPAIYNPHDLQHVHYPQFFSPKELAQRHVMYRTACQLSNTVVVGSEWIKQDVIRQFQLNPEKVQVIPWAPPSTFFPQVSAAQLEDARRRLDLPATFALYPAVTWPHKNHVRLLEALAVLRDARSISINLVCTGALFHEYWPTVRRRIADLRLESQVKFLGFLSEADLRAVYRLARFLILPTLFEADSCPIHEAWSEGLPVASSNLTALPEQVGDAGLLFDALDVSQIASALERMATDEGLRQRLEARGRQRVLDFDWSRTAKAYRAVYRRAAGINLGEEDRWLLQWNWMKEPGMSPQMR